MREKILHYIKGFHFVTVQGNSIERFLNLCANHNIPLWNLKPREDGMYSFSLESRYYIQLDPLLEKTHTQIVHLEVNGLRHFFKKYKKRKMFVIGCCLCMLFVYSLTFFIWDIHIIGNSQYTKEEVTAYIEENFVTIGTLKKKVNCAKLEEILREEYDQIAWISCELKGTQLRITWKETLPVQEDMKEEKPCDIVARKSAIVTSIITRNGTPMVKEKSVVKQGDVLISGIIHLYDETNTLLESESIVAQGDVLGKTTYQYEDSFPIHYYEKQYTGKERHFFGIQILENIYVPFIPKNKYHSSDTIQKNWEWKLGHTYVFPISFLKYERKEFSPVRKSYTKEQAILKEKKRLEKFLKNLSEKGVEIVENNVKIEVGDDVCQGKGTITVIESIGKIRKIEDEGVIP